EWSFCEGDRCGDRHFEVTRCEYREHLTRSLKRLFPESVVERFCATGKMLVSNGDNRYMGLVRRSAWPARRNDDPRNRMTSTRIFRSASRIIGCAQRRASIITPTIRNMRGGILLMSRSMSSKPISN